MSNEKYNQIIDEVYKRYTDKYVGYEDVPNKELFVHEIKTNPEFSEKWGLKIEERELSLEERDDLRLKLILDYLNKKGIMSASFEDFKRDESIIPNIDWRREVRGWINWIDYGNEVKRNRVEEIYEDIKNIPTKLITIIYNNETIEVYE